MLKNWPLVKNPQFSSYPHETWWKWLPQEIIVFTNFHEDWTKIVDFLLMANFWMSAVFSYSVFTCPWGGSGSSGHSFSGLIHDIPQAPSHKQSFLSFKQSLSVLHFRGHGLFLPFFSSWTDSVCLGGHSSGFVNPWVLDVDLRLRKWSEKS